MSTGQGLLVAVTRTLRHTDDLAEGCDVRLPGDRLQGEDLDAVIGDLLPAHIGSRSGGLLAVLLFTIRILLLGVGVLLLCELVLAALLGELILAALLGELVLAALLGEGILLGLLTELVLLLGVGVLLLCELVLAALLGELILAALLAEGILAALLAEGL